MKREIAERIEAYGKDIDVKVTIHGDGNEVAVAWRDNLTDNEQWAWRELHTIEQTECEGIQAVDGPLCPCDCGFVQPSISAFKVA